VRLPALAEEDELHRVETVFGSQSFCRKAGEALHPEREPAEMLAQLRRTLGEYNFAGQYQQAPSPQGGGMVKAAWFKSYAANDQPEKCDQIVQSWDTANKASELSDFSVCTSWGIQGKNLYLLHVLRKRMEYPELKRAVREHCKAFAANVVLIEDKASGTQLIQELIEQGLYAVTRYQPQSDKIMRMHAQTAMIENGFVHLPKEAAWLAEYLHELTVFPKGKHDDQVPPGTSSRGRPPRCSTGSSAPARSRRTGCGNSINKPRRVARSPRDRNPIGDGQTARHPPAIVLSAGSSTALSRRRLGQLQGALRDSRRRGFGFTRDLHGREGEFDPILVEGLFDHRIGLAADHELFAWHGHHLRPDRHRVIAELVDALHLQGLDDQRRKFRVLLQLQPDLLDQLPRLFEVAVIGDADRDLVDDPVAAHVFDRAQQVERHGEDRAAVMPQPDRADTEPLHGALVAAGLDVFADPERVVDQIEHAGDDVAGEGLRTETDRDADDPRTGDQRGDLHAHRRQRHQHGDGNIPAKAPRKRNPVVSST
jgi:predicted phage terminase large subunit-like protein